MSTSGKNRILSNKSAFSLFSELFRIHLLIFLRSPLSASCLFDRINGDVINAPTFIQQLLHETIGGKR